MAEIYNVPIALATPRIFVRVYTERTTLIYKRKATKSPLQGAPVEFEESLFLATEAYREVSDADDAFRETTLIVRCEVTGSFSGAEDREEQLIFSRMSEPVAIKKAIELHVGLVGNIRTRLGAEVKS